MCDKGKLLAKSQTTIRFFEHEVNLHDILAKFAVATNQDQPLVMTDMYGIEILDSEGTRGNSDQVVLIVMALP